MIPISVKNQLPNDKTYVLVHYTGDRWKDSDDQEGCEWKVAKFVRGISQKEREEMEECERKRTICSEDEWGNNQRPFFWDEFGPGGCSDRMWIIGCRCRIFRVGRLKAQICAQP